MAVCYLFGSVFFLFCWKRKYRQVSFVTAAYIFFIGIPKNWNDDGVCKKVFQKIGMMTVFVKRCSKKLE